MYLKFCFNSFYFFLVSGEKEYDTHVVCVFHLSEQFLKSLKTVNTIEYFDKHSLSIISLSYFKDNIVSN